MITDLKKSLKLIKYGYQFKMNMLLALFLAVIGIVMITLGRGRLAELGVFLFAMGPMAMVQIISSLLCVNLPAASYKRRYIDGLASDIIAVVVGVGTYGVYILFLPVYYLFNSSETYKGGLNLIMAATAITVLSIYQSMVQKVFFRGNILYIFFAFLTFILMDVLTEIMEDGIRIYTGMIAGLIIILVGNILAVGIRKALYKKPIQPFSVGMDMKKLYK